MGGVLLYHRTNQSVDHGSGTGAYFNGKCAQWPHTSLIDQKNPTCDVRYYRGGQWACKHMWSLLDADQEIPWADQPLVFYHKYRFWVQPYVESYHKPVVLGQSHGSTLLIGSPWEYDVPKCAPGIAGCSKDIPEFKDTWVHIINGSMVTRHTFVSLNDHSHAPTTLGADIYACAKGTALQDCNQTSGKLICKVRPAYGGTNYPGIAGTRFDEPGYVALRECHWGSADFGLEAPLDLDGMTIHVVKYSNATDGHYGEMSGGQPWVMLNAAKDAVLV